MNCADCRQAIESGANGAAVAEHASGCAECARELALIEREDAMYAAYAAKIEVPEMWGEVEARIRRDRAPRRRARVWRASLAVAAALALFAIAVATFAPERPAAPVVEKTVPERTDPAALASERYRATIAPLERAVTGRPATDRAAASTAAILPELTESIRGAEVALAAAPADPLTVTRMVAAYEAKLDLLRGGSAYAQ